MVERGHAQIGIKNAQGQTCVGSQSRNFRIRVKFGVPGAACYADRPDPVTTLGNLP
jgi:hypothetical protein